jgi:GT2 family glycosyltransferase
MNATPAALVTVAVRTMGRDTLPTALDAVAAQTHRPVEIVLVDAADAGIATESHRGVPIRVVRNGRLDRPRAANAGLDAARGDWILFLDEDDAIEPPHLAQLLAAATRERTAVAYSQSRLVDPAGREERIFGGPFNRLALFRSNYLAMASVLFSRELVAQGCRVDESFPIFEDWDLWLQLAMRTPFAFTGQPTAIWRAALGRSGAGSGANLDREAVLAQRERLMRKWQAARAALEALG